MHYSMYPDMTRLEPGDRFLGQTKGYPNPVETRVMMLAEPGPRDRYAAVDRRGRRYVAESHHDTLRDPVSGEEIRPWWTLPLPDLPDDEAVRYAQALARRGNGPPIVLHVRAIGETHAAARLLFAVEDEQDMRNWQAEIASGATEEYRSFSWTAHGSTGVSDEDVTVPVENLPEGCEPGDVVAAAGFDCRILDGTLVTRLERGRGMRDAGPAVAMKGVAAEALEDVFPKRAGRARSAGRLLSRGPQDMPRTAGPEEFGDEAFNARLRLEPDELLMLWYRDPDRGDAACYVLGRTGYLFNVTDSVSDLFYGDSVDPGVWLFTGAKAWSYTSYEGEHDWGVDGDFVPATEADFAKFGFDAASLSAEIRDILEDAGFEGVEEEGLALAQVAMARTVMEAKEAAARETALETAAPSPA